VRSDAAGVLVIWHDVEESAEAEFVKWHVREHMPERVGLPGFLRGQRYVALEGKPRYFNFYEADDAASFSSPAYRERLNNPTPWTRRVVAHFANTARTVCRRVAQAGRGDGAFVETLRVSLATSTAMSQCLPQLIQRDGIVASTLLQGIPAASAADTAEKKLRSQPDQISDWVLISESVGPAYFAAEAYRAQMERSLREAGAKPGWQRAVYQLQFSLSRT
jgi:hypothetical protein